jgi:hypothetical protein
LVPKLADRGRKLRHWPPPASPRRLLCSPRGLLCDHIERCSAANIWQ